MQVQRTHPMNSTTFAVLLVAILALAVVVAAAAQKAKTAPGSYRARKLMSENELEFFGRLTKAVPEYFIFPQVAMAAILQAKSTDRKIAHRDFLRIAQQRVDYLVCKADGTFVAVVELDDKTHQAARDKVRDERLQQAGIRTLRFESRNKPAVDVLRSALISPAPADAMVAHAAGVKNAMDTAAPPSRRQ
ncbi:DUF2726 domain-containing protein [Pseudoduganella plicata]|nr:DUF2726 domain-containing protein [Pseudoduganella plicata]